MIYVPANENLCQTMSGQQEVEYTPGKGYTGARIGGMSIQPGADHVGEVQAWNVDTGQKVWTHNYAKSPNWGGDAGDRRRSRIHAAEPTIASSTPTTQPLASCCGNFPTTSGILAPPSTFTVDGKQYVAVESGWGGDSSADAGQLEPSLPGPISRSARGRRGLGVRARVKITSLRERAR